MRVLAVVLSVLTVLLGVAVTGVGPSARAAVAVSGGAVATTGSVAGAGTVLMRDGEGASEESDGESSRESGPELDPLTEAQAENNKNKIVVGIIAAVLLGAVLWGRYLRKKRASGG